MENLNGQWTYRSFRNNQNLGLEFNSIRFGAGKITFEVKDSTIKGILDMGGNYKLTLSGTANELSNNTVELTWTGKGIANTPTENWIYDYHGYIDKNWSNGKNQALSITGTVIRTVKHGNSPEGYVGTFHLIKNHISIRKNALSLTEEEKERFINAVLELKRIGRYDQYVLWHKETMMHPTFKSYEPQESGYRNNAHRGPAFLPWHREFLLRFEEDLKRIDSSVSVPYWNWVDDSKLPDPAKSKLWDSSFMGGNGLKEDNWKVQDGAFSYKNGNWKIIHEVPGNEDGRDLVRNFKSIYPDLPDEDDLKLLMGESMYDLPNYDSSNTLQGFRNRLEGWLRKEGDSRISKSGTQLHNRVHVWINGHMIKMTSPNDPVFFLHHCFVDKIWWDWQQAMMISNPKAYPHYYPVEDGPIGHNLNDKMEPFGVKISDLFDIRSLGYIYDDSEKEFNTKAIYQERKPSVFEQ